MEHKQNPNTPPALYPPSPCNDGAQLFGESLMTDGIGQGWDQDDSRSRFNNQDINQIRLWVPTQ